MSPAVLSLGALLVVLAVSLTSRLNVGVLAIALAWPSPCSARAGRPTR
jgi:hypothetical protein